MHCKPTFFFGFDTIIISPLFQNTQVPLLCRWRSFYTRSCFNPPSFPPSCHSSYHVQKKKKNFLTNSYGICMFCVFFNLRYVFQSIATVHLLSKRTTIKRIRIKRKGIAAVVLDEMNKIVIFFFFFSFPAPASVQVKCKVSSKGRFCPRFEWHYWGKSKSTHCNQEPKPYLSQF